MEICISGLGYYIPKNRKTAEEISKISGIPEFVLKEKIGFEEIPIASDKEHPSEMGLQAARIALENAGIKGSDIDVVIFAATGDYDYRLWSPAAYIQDKLGTKCYGFEVNNACNGGNLAINVVKSIMQSDPSLQNALVVTSDRLSSLVNYENTNTLSLFHLGDGAAAIVISKDTGSNRILSYESITNGSVVDNVKVPFGGTRINPLVNKDIDIKDYYLQIEDPEQLDAIFSKIYIQNYIKTITGALKKSELSTESIDYLLLNQVKSSSMTKILESFDLSAENTYRSITHYGHMGSVDTIFGLAKLTEENRFKENDIIVLASSGIGFSWGATVIRH